MQQREDRLTLLDLNQAMKRAVEKAVRENKALKLSYLKIEDGRLVLVTKEGTEQVVGQPHFGMVKVDRKSFRLKEQ